jgi:membrane-bound inhibitor of C-type lysozyme
MLNLVPRFLSCPRVVRIARNTRAIALWGAMLAAASPVFAGSAAGAEGTPVSASAAPDAPAVPTAPTPTPVPPPTPAGRPFALSFGNIKVVSRSIVAYRCADGHDMGVAYMNTDNGQSFAVIRIEGRHLVFVDTAAGSGARYVAGRYIWWNKGDEGNLYDAMAGENAAPVAKDCTAIKQ